MGRGRCLLGESGSISGIVHASVDYQHADTQSSLNYQGLTITQPGCLVLAFGGRNKTSTKDGASYSAFSGFTLPPNGQFLLSGANISGAFNYAIQSTATNFASANNPLSGSADSPATQAQETCVIALLPASGGGGGSTGNVSRGLLGVGQ